MNEFNIVLYSFGNVDITLRPRYIFGSLFSPLFLNIDDIRNTFQSVGTPSFPIILKNSAKHLAIVGQFKFLRSSGEIKLYPHDFFVFNKRIPLLTSSHVKIGAYSIDCECYNI